MTPVDSEVTQLRPKKSENKDEQDPENKIGGTGGGPILALSVEVAKNGYVLHTAGSDWEDFSVYVDRSELIAELTRLL